MYVYIGIYVYTYKYIYIHEKGVMEKGLGRRVVRGKGGGANDIQPKRVRTRG
jgi:hypothetical protein